MKKECKGCGKTFEKRLLSKKGYCFTCALNRMTKARKQMMEKKGLIYEKWKRHYIFGMKAYLERLEKEGK